MESSSWCSQSASSGSVSPPPRFDNRFGQDSSSQQPVQSGTKDVFNEVVRGRKSWKTLKGGEMVWPPELEAALLEGLASYQPDDSRETRLLGRFPMRNRYISAYIYRKTGKLRTAKQVGSRLQQLRDTCSGKKLQHLLSPCRKPTESKGAFDYSTLQRYGFSKIPSLSGESDCLTSPPANSHGWLGKPSASPMYIYILPENGRGYSDRPISDSSSSLGAADYPRPIRSIDPTLTFITFSPLNRPAQSCFKVYNSHGYIVHTEDSPIALASSDERGYYYSTSLVPEFWETICKHRDPTEFTMEHKIVQDDTQLVLFSAVYKFRYPASEARLTSRPSISTHYDKSAHDTSSPVQDDFQSPSTASDDHDLFDLSDIGLPPVSTLETTSYDLSCFSGFGRSVSLPNSPRTEVPPKDLYQSRRGSDPSLAWNYLNSS